MPAIISHSLFVKMLRNQLQLRAVEINIQFIVLL